MSRPPIGSAPFLVDYSSWPVFAVVRNATPRLGFTWPGLVSGATTAAAVLCDLPVVRPQSLKPRTDGDELSWRRQSPVSSVGTRRITRPSRSPKQSLRPTFSTSTTPGTQRGQPRMTLQLAMGARSPKTRIMPMSAQHPLARVGRSLAGRGGSVATRQELPPGLLNEMRPLGSASYVIPAHRRAATPNILPWIGA